ncbi:MAG: hypothetical protein AAF191_03025, partial [Verrucomicrobiota bacterium]
GGVGSDLMAHGIASDFVRSCPVCARGGLRRGSRRGGRVANSGRVVRRQHVVVNDDGRDGRARY